MKNNEIQGGLHKSVINCSAGHMSTENVLCSASRFPPVKIRESIEKRPYLIRSRCKLNFYYKTKPTQKQAFEAGFFLMAAYPLVFTIFFYTTQSRHPWWESAG